LFSISSRNKSSYHGDEEKYPDEASPRKK